MISLCKHLVVVPIRLFCYLPTQNLARVLPYDRNQTSLIWEAYYYTMLYLARGSMRPGKVPLLWTILVLPLLWTILVLPTLVQIRMLF